MTSRTQRSIRRHLIAGICVVALLVGGGGGWACATKIAGAVISSGHLVVDSNVKKVQHPTGGIVAELLVHEGDRVTAGEILVRLDGTQAQATVSMLSKELDELLARKARLEAERDDADEIVFPNELLQRTEDSDVSHLIAGEQKLFELRHTARNGQKAQLRERVAQLREEIQGLLGQAKAKDKEIELINKELVGVRELRAKNLVPAARLTSLERDVARLEGERSQLIGYSAEAKGKITETELQIIQVDQDLRSDVGKELAEIRAKISELTEQRVAAADQLKRIEIRAPQDGRVHELAVHTIGGVIGAGEPIMLIVPDTDTLTIEARIAPQDIDQLHLGQVALLRFSAFNQRTTPEIYGQVNLISADLTQDQRTGASYYVVHITPDANEIARLGNFRLVPGMPVEAFLQTDERTVLSYLIKPLRDQIVKAFRES
jgi:membrane fusion protein, type I secretion system